MRVTVAALVLAAVACRDRGVNRLMGTGEANQPVAMTHDDRLREAVRAGKRDDVEAMLRTGADASAPDKLGLTPLALAARHTDDVELARVLLSAAPATLEAADSLQRTPLSWACGEGHVNVCNFLLSQHAATAARDTTGKTPLFHAVLRGEVASATLLMASHADPDARDKFGDTPLMMAASKNNAAMVEALLRAGASTEVKDDQGRTPLARATAPAVRQLLTGKP